MLRRANAARLSRAQCRIGTVSITYLSDFTCPIERNSTTPPYPLVVTFYAAASAFKTLPIQFGVLLTHLSEIAFRPLHPYKMGVSARARKFPVLNQVLKLRPIASLGEVRQQPVTVDGVLGRRPPAHELLGEQ